MIKNIFINLPVADLERSKSFFTQIGFTINTEYTDDTAACVVLSESIYVMLLTIPKFESFTSRSVADAQKTTEVINAFSLEEKVAVDAFFDKVLAAGGASFRDPDDYGFMYSRSFTDPDGHIWEAFWMDPQGIPKNVSDETKN